MEVQIGIEVLAVEAPNPFHIEMRRYGHNPCACESPHHSWLPLIRCRCCAAADSWLLDRQLAQQLRDRGRDGAAKDIAKTAKSALQS
jgi:hypothetical protein